MSFSFSRVLITGGATGIGLTMARSLLKGGAERICIQDVLRDKGERAAQELNTEYGECSVMFIEGDVTKKSHMHDLFNSAMTTFGGLDLVINNAGILNGKQWEREIDINMTALVRGSFLAMQHMGKNFGGCGGTLVNLSSILGLQAMGSCPTYVGTKHGVLGFSRSLGMPFNFKRTGVRVLIICPGVTITPLITEAPVRASTTENAKELKKELDSVPPQAVECVGAGLMHALACGESGSVWVPEGGEKIYEIEIPNRLTLRKCE